MKRHWLIIIPLLLAAALIYWLINQQTKPPQAQVSAPPPTVRYIVAKPQTLTPQITTVATVQAATTWQAVSQVNGVIASVADNLRMGDWVTRGETLLVIDDTDYRLQERQAQAQLAATQARLDELQLQQRNSQAVLAIEQKLLTLRHREFARKQRLAKRGSLSQSAVDAENQQLLIQQRTVANLQTQVATAQTQIRQQQAQQDLQQAQLDAARQDRQDARIQSPLTGRISSLEVEQGEYVRQGQGLFRVDGSAKAEIWLNVALGQLSGLLGSDQHVTPKAISALQGQVQQPNDGKPWPMTISRLDGRINPQSRMIGLIGVVDQPYKPQFGQLPLIHGEFVQATVQGRPRINQLLVPSVAVHNQRLYLLNDQNRLVIRPIKTGWSQAGLTVVRQGLNEGERVIISELIPAIQGMALQGQLVANDLAIN